MVGSQHIEDDGVVGSSDKIMFYAKELKANVEDRTSSHNPFLVGKLDQISISNFNFDLYQGYIEN